mmetsp:Transcript_23800/g.71397  ORF Transcript_23800/g.71397 Transcript_23800/m.71397 type:complete len:122 (-) Transcript_23800:1396-1761(-)
MCQLTRPLVLSVQIANYPSIFWRLKGLLGPTPGNRMLVFLLDWSMNQGISNAAAADGLSFASTAVNRRIRSFASSLTVSHALSLNEQVVHLFSTLEFAGCVPDKRTKSTIPTLHISAAAPS